MATRSVTIREISSSTIRPSWREAIALVRGIAAASDDCTSRAPGGGTLDEFALDDTGRVFAIARGCAPISLADLAGLLVRLLPVDAFESTEPVPGGVQFAITTALSDAETSARGSVTRFSESLAPFETAHRATVLRGLFDRYCVFHDHRIRRAALAFGDGRVVSGRRAERRSTGPGVDELRRFLREADRELFLALRMQAPAARAVGRRNGPSGDMLRRSLRDADRTNYELRRMLGRTRHLIIWPRHRAAVGLGVLLIAATAVAERQPLSRALLLMTRPSTLADARSNVVAEPAHPLAIATTGQAAAPGPPTPTHRRRPHNATVDAGLYPTAGEAASGGAAAGIEGEPADAPRFGDAPGSGQQTGRLVMAVDLADRPVFSPAFPANHSALFEEESQPPDRMAPAPEGNEQNEFVRVLSIANDRGRNYHPRLSPDGRMIAFDSDRDGVRGVYVATRDGRNVRRVSGTEYAAFAAWSPDGVHLAFVRSEPDQPTVWNVWSINVQSGATARLTAYSTGQPWGVSWFPDGRRICYAHEHELVVLDTLNGETHSYASPRADRMARMPVVSPDGSRVLFQVDNDGAWLLEMADGSMREVLADPTAEDFAWSPDGRRIVFRSRPGGWSFWSFDPGH